METLPSNRATLEFNLMKLFSSEDILFKDDTNRLRVFSDISPCFDDGDIINFTFERMEDETSYLSFEMTKQEAIILANYLIQLSKE